MDVAKILVIDDDKAFRDLARRMLESAGHSVIEAVDGIEGVKEFKKETPDVVVADILMPKADGLDVIRRILDIRPKAKISAISGCGRLSGQTYLSHARKFGACAVLEKPFAPEQFLSLIDSVYPALEAVS